MMPRKPITIIAALALIAVVAAACSRKKSDTEEQASATASSSSPAENVNPTEPATTPQPTEEPINPYVGTAQGRQWLDMGTSVKWADCNIGASSPHDHGHLFAWGETETKDIYDTDNSLTYGKSIGSIAGQPAYDAARAIWGGEWRMPTREECQELIDSCAWHWDGAGYEVTARNGNVLYLPAAGWFNITSIQDAGDLGRYWTASPANDQEAYSLWINLHRKWLEPFDRDTGFSIRPVLP